MQAGVATSRLLLAGYGWAGIASAPVGAVVKLQLVRHTVGGMSTIEAASRTRLLLQLGWLR